MIFQKITRQTGSVFLPVCFMMTIYIWYAQLFFNDHPLLKHRSCAKGQKSNKIVYGLSHFPRDNKETVKWTKFNSQRNYLNSFNKFLSKRTLLLILKFYCFVNNKTFDANTSEKLFTITAVLNSICKKYHSLHTPETYDKICFVRLQWKQYIPSKRNHFDLKCLNLCKNAFGYIWNFCVYTGRGTDCGSNFPITLL